MSNRRRSGSARERKFAHGAAAVNGTTNGGAGGGATVNGNHKPAVQSNGSAHSENHVHKNGFIPKAKKFKQSIMAVTIDKLHYIPIAASGCGFAAIFISYLIAFFLGDVVDHLPYISDAGGDPPQSGIFGLFIVAGSAFGLVCFWVINIFIKECNLKGNSFVKRLMFIFNIGIIVGAISLVVVAVNPIAHLRRDGKWVYPVFIPHMIGAGGFFTCGTLVMCLYTVITYIYCPRYFSKAAFYQRLIISSIGFFALFLTAATLPVFELAKRSYTPDSGTKHVPGAFLSVTGEWMMVVCYETFFLTLINDFKRMKLNVTLEFTDESSKRFSEESS